MTYLNRAEVSALINSNINQAHQAIEDCWDEHNRCWECEHFRIGGRRFTGYQSTNTMAEHDCVALTLQACPGVLDALEVY